MDVRNPNEAEIACIAGSELIPLNKIESGEAIEKVRQLASGRRLYVYCKLGGRSAKALTTLKRHGIEGVNVTGGIDAWAKKVDNLLPRYGVDRHLYRDSLLKGFQSARFNHYQLR